MNASELIDLRIKQLDDWRGPVAARIRELIHQADPEIDEEWKWDTPVFSHNGLVCAIGAFRDHVKVNFFKGASLADPKKVFNAGLEAKTMRSVDFFEGDEIDELALKEMIRIAVIYNLS